MSEHTRSALPDWEVAARVAIDSLLAAYVAGVDGGPLQELVELFTEDGVLVVHGGKEYRGRDGMLSFLTASRETRGESPVGRIRHFNSRSHVRFDSPTSASGTTYFFAMNEAHGVDHWGLYEEDLIALDGVWYFKRRAVVIEGADPGGWIGSGVAIVSFDRT
ncbi:MAG TPA: nuclear transport factor 2 family protein [Solirubrobacteraceae bacterium]|jgi:hypothetical protein